MTSSRITFGFLVWLLVFTVGTTNAMAAKDRELAPSPQFVSVGVPPNIMFVLDDSGSMDWSYMPDDISGYSGRKRAKSSTFNKQYYNPEISYTLPVDHNGNSLPAPSFFDAWDDGYRHYRGLWTSTVNLSTLFRPHWGYGGAYGTSQPAYYYVMDKCGDVNDDGCYTKVVVNATSGPGGTDERQNFANWYSYYRTRAFTARAAIGRAFSTLPNQFRLGWGRINKQSESWHDGAKVRAVQHGVRQMDNAHRADYFDWLYKTEPSGGTPLRRALEGAGKYFDNKSSAGPWSTTPGKSGGEMLACRQSFTILMSDGYWNGSAPSVGNADGVGVTSHSGPGGLSGGYSPSEPFKDGRSNTLADVAMYYWKNDLHDGLANQVPTNARDSAFWQHMVTYTVGLGVEGTINPQTAFDAIESGDTINWPSSGNSAKIDDMLHAAVNSRGDFFSAGDPDTFATALANVLKDIVARSDATTSVALASPRLVPGFLNYRAEFDSEKWSGDVVGIDPEDGKVKHKASEELAFKSVDARNIFTWNPSDGKGVPFNNGIQDRIMADADSEWQANDLIAYLRGDAALEGSQFRERASRLGDIVNSRVVFSGRGNEGWGAVNADYLTYVGEDKNDPRDCSTCNYKRKDTIFVGANDGMLHAFDARTLKEFFAYVPSTVHHKLHRLADPDYGHEFYVDGQIAVGDAYIDSSWGTYLVGTLGAGGRGVFALDVTKPESFSAENVLWELTAEDLGDGNWNNPELGYTFSDPVITRLENGTWVAIFGNGYNSNSGQARLFVVDLKDGTVLQRLPLGSVPASSEFANGLSGVESLRDPATGKFVKRVYAGDLNGTMWRVDFNNSTATVATGMGDGLFTDPDGQAITATPTLGLHPSGGVMVYFGTGKFFEVGDKNDESLQRAYAIRDRDAPVNSSQVAENTLSAPVTVDGIPTRQIVATGPGVGGWSIDLAVGGAQKGERVLIKPELKFGKLIFASYEPVDNACTPGGAQRTFLVDAISGGGSTHEIGFGAPMAPPIAIKPPSTTPTPPGEVENPGLYDPDDPSPVFPTPPGADGSDDRAEWCSRTGIPPLFEGDSFLAIGVLCEGRQTWREAR